MDARAYLEELWQIDRRIRDKQDLREHYRSMACRTPSGLSVGSAIGPAADGPMADYCVRLVDIERELEDDARRLQERCRAAREAIGRLPDPRLRDVLELRYFRGMAWEAIADHMHYERTQVWRMHTRALEQIAPYLPAAPATPRNAEGNATQRTCMVS